MRRSLSVFTCHRFDSTSRSNAATHVRLCRLHSSFASLLANLYCYLLAPVCFGSAATCAATFPPFVSVTQSATALSRTRIQGFKPQLCAHSRVSCYAGRRARTSRGSLRPSGFTRLNLVTDFAVHSLLAFGRTARVLSRFHATAEASRSPSIPPLPSRLPVPRTTIVARTIALPSADSGAPYHPRGFLSLLHQRRSAACVPGGLWIRLKCGVRHRLPTIFLSWFRFCLRPPFGSRDFVRLAVDFFRLLRSGRW